MVYLTDAGGVWDSKRRLITVVPVQSIRSLIQKGIVRDGMIPKLRSCARTLSQKVGEIDILSPTVPNALLDVVQNGARVGTRIVRNV